MIDKWGLIFGNKPLENQFRHYVRKAGNHEVGGYLLATPYIPRIWHRRVSDAMVRRALKFNGMIDYIEQFIAVPNASPIPYREYDSKMREGAEAIAQLTASTLGHFPRWLIDFHSHPNNDPTPSPNDIGYAMAHCQVYPGLARLCIVMPDPLRLWLYFFEYDARRPHIPRNETVVAKFWTWNMHAVRDCFA